MFSVFDTSMPSIPKVSPKKVPNKPKPTKMPDAASSILRLTCPVLSTLCSEKNSDEGILVFLIEPISTFIDLSYSNEICDIFVADNARRLSSLLLALSNMPYNFHTFMTWQMKHIKIILMKDTEILLSVRYSSILISACYIPADSPEPDGS